MRDTTDCNSCAHQYQGADLIKRCRVHSSGLPCSPAMADGCKAFRYEPGSDAEEIEVILCSGCCGRGD